MGCVETNCSAIHYCPGELIYRPSVQPCGRTCESLAKERFCPKHEKHISGCFCPDGLVLDQTVGTRIDFQTPGLSLVLRPANERRRCFVTTSLIDWAQT